MRRRTAITTIIACLSTFLRPRTRAAEAAVLSTQRNLAPGLTLEEWTTIEVKDGHMTMLLGSQPLKGTATALLRDRLTRTFESADEQRVEFHECTRSIVFGLGTKPGAPKLAAGQLGGKKVSGTRDEAGAWTFALAGKKATAAEATALKQFSAFNVAVESASRLWGAEPREIGKPWRPDFSAITRAYPGIVVTIDCRLDELKRQDGDERARITVGGLVTARYGEGNRVEARFTGFIVRSLRDQIDVEVDLAGTLRFDGAVGRPDDADKSGGAKAALEAPLSLKRTVKVKAP